MNGDGLVWLILLMILFIFNRGAIHLNKSNKLDFIWSGIIIVILGIILGFLLGTIFVNLEHNMGESGEGGAYGGAFIGLSIIGNGIIYFLIGLYFKVLNIIKNYRSK